LIARAAQTGGAWLLSTPATCSANRRFQPTSSGFPCCAIGGIMEHARRHPPDENYLFAKIVVFQALLRHKERVSNPDRKVIIGENGS
jgi:hypothetical protein